MENGGIVQEVWPISPSCSWVLVEEDGEEYTTYVDPCGRSLQIRDFIWWMGDKIYWTPYHSILPGVKPPEDVELPKIGKDSPTKRDAQAAITAMLRTEQLHGVK